MLLASGNVKARARLEENLPTAGLVIVDFPFDDWRIFVANPAAWSVS